MERFCDPLLPKTKVRRAFVSGLMPKSMITELNDLGIRTHVLGRSENLNGELAYHPDILLNNFRKGLWLCERNASYLPDDIPKSIFREREFPLKDLYPYDCPLNNFTIGNTLICGMSADYIIKANAKYEKNRIIFVQQNYTKCCTIPINKQALITCDYLMSMILKQNNFDVLYVRDCEDVKLKGYNYGFIGGCAAMLSDNLLAFTGNLNSYRYHRDIRDFCANHKVDAFSLSSDPMYDYGGILPITEYVPEEEKAFSDYCNLEVGI